MFTTTSRSKVQHLRGALNNAKKNDMTPANFFTKMKGYASELAAIGKLVDEDEVVGFILNGLDGSYNSTGSSVNVNPGTTLDELYDQICSHDQCQAMLSEQDMTWVISTPRPTLHSVVAWLIVIAARALMTASRVSVDFWLE
jgi:hypothetical protein